MELTSNINSLQTDNQTFLFLDKFLIFIFFIKPHRVFPHIEMWGKTRAGFEKPYQVFNFDHFFFHHDGIYFFSHNYICFAPLYLYLCILVLLSLLHH